MNIQRNKIPINCKGAHSDSSFSITTKSLDEAISLYENAKRNLLHVNDWKKIAGKGAEFQLMNDKGENISGIAHNHCFIRIHIPGSGTAKYDWVRIETIETEEKNEYNSILMRVRPTAAPGTSHEEDHFFSAEASSNFLIEQESYKVTASVHGRNETPNTHASNLWDKIRRFIIGVFAMIGLNKPQWLALCKGLLLYNEVASYQDKKI